MAYSDFYFTPRETWRDWRIEADELMRLARVTRACWKSAAVVAVCCDCCANAARVRWAWIR